MSPSQKFFDVISTTQNCESIAGQLTQLASLHVNPSPSGTKTFDWTSFKQAIDERPEVDVTIAAFEVPFSGKTAFRTLPSHCASIIIRPLAMPITDADLSPVLEKSLNDLKCAKESGWADFGKLSLGEPPKCLPLYGWEYRVLILAEDPTGGTKDLAGMVVGVNVSSPKLQKEEDWYPEPKGGSDQEVTLKLTLMKLDIEPGFKV
ncbi:hypothetical protein RSAG8_05753, partial [Rhizoctonia solani AG-8 WAC10335]